MNGLTNATQLVKLLMFNQHNYYMVKESRREIKLEDYTKERKALSPMPNEQSILDFMYLTGARIGEALKVKTHDIDFEEQKATLHTEKNPHENQRTAYFYPKTGPALELIESVKKHVLSREEHGLVWEFPNRKSARHWIWEVSWKYYGTNDHSFRHTHAVALTRDLRLSQRELMNQMGWWQLNTCMAYLTYDFEASVRKRMGIIEQVEFLHPKEAEK